MIQAVTVTNVRGESLRMELAHPEKSGMLIYEITGIGEPTGTINTIDNANFDGATFNSARAQQRNIVLSIKLMANPTVEIQRHKCYRYFPVKGHIKLKFETDTRTTFIDGYVETNDPVIFSSQEYVQISIICPDPYFYDYETINEAYYGVHNMFEFPFENDSLTEPLLIMGEIRDNTRSVVLYEGEAETGFNITITARARVRHIRIQNLDTYGFMVIDTDRIKAITGVDFGNGDEIQISTFRGARSAQMLHLGIWYNVLGAIERDSEWFQLVTGENPFMFSCQEGERDMTMSFSYRNIYGGV